VIFKADAKVELDIAGKPMRIEVSPDLPAPVRQVIERRVASWHFSPPTRDGKVDTGVTYLSLGACAIPLDGGGYRLAVDFKGNGPRAERMLVPYYPVQARRAGREATLVAKYVVETDGSATLQAIDYIDGIRDRREGFDEAVQAWVDALRYRPEEFGGKPVRTRLETRMDFVLAGKGSAQLQRYTQVRAQRSPECRLATTPAASLEPVALDSPIRVDPTG
jgi:hypothetical protein